MADESANPEEYFPLGPGGPGTGGLLKDVLNFALRNARNYADKLPQPGQQLTASDVSAINPAGAVAGGIYRTLGLERQSGALNPAQFIAKLQQQPNYARYKQLIESSVRKHLGDKFTGYRGAAVGDPLMNVVSKGELPAATAISTRLEKAQEFARTASDVGKAGRVAQGEFTPESVLSLLPKRNTSYSSEAELIVDPRWAQSLKTINRTVAPDKNYPYTTIKNEGDSLLNMAMQDALEKLKMTRPIPGSGAVKEGFAVSSYTDDIKSALEQASQVPKGWDAMPSVSSWSKSSTPVSDILLQGKKSTPIDAQFTPSVQQSPSLLSGDELMKLLEQLKGAPDAPYVPSWTK